MVAELRPFLWPPWSGRYGSPGLAAILAVTWLFSLAAALTARLTASMLVTEDSSTFATLMSHVAINLPWALAVLWTLHAGAAFFICSDYMIAPTGKLGTIFCLVVRHV